MSCFAIISRDWYFIHSVGGAGRLSFPRRGFAPAPRGRRQLRRARVPAHPHQARSKRSRFITLVQAATKSCTNFACESAWA